MNLIQQYRTLSDKEAQSALNNITHKNFNYLHSATTNKVQRGFILPNKGKGNIYRREDNASAHGYASQPNSLPMQLGF